MFSFCRSECCVHYWTTSPRPQVLNNEDHRRLQSSQAISRASMDFSLSLSLSLRVLCSHATRETEWGTWVGGGTYRAKDLGGQLKELSYPEPGSQVSPAHPSDRGSVKRRARTAWGAVGRLSEFALLVSGREFRFAVDCPKIVPCVLWPSFRMKVIIFVFVFQEYLGCAFQQTGAVSIQTARQIQEIIMIWNRRNKTNDKINLQRETLHFRADSWTP